MSFCCRVVWKSFFASSSARAPGLAICSRSGRGHCSPNCTLFDAYLIRTHCFGVMFMLLMWTLFNGPGWAIPSRPFLLQRKTAQTFSEVGAIWCVMDRPLLKHPGCPKRWCSESGAVLWACGACVQEEISVFPKIVKVTLSCKIINILMNRCVRFEKPLKLTARLCTHCNLRCLKRWTHFCYRTTSVRSLK